MLNQLLMLGNYSKYLKSCIKIIEFKENKTFVFEKTKFSEKLRKKEKLKPLIPKGSAESSVQQLFFSDNYI